MELLKQVRFSAEKNQQIQGFFAHPAHRAVARLPMEESTIPFSLPGL